MSNYHLGSLTLKEQNYWQNLKINFLEFWKYLADEKLKLIIAFAVIILNSLAGIITPYIIAKATDNYIITRNTNGLMITVFELLGLYILTIICGFLQSRLMGSISQNTLFRLRNSLFSKIQDLPTAFFNQNKAGDLMSRLNNDADKLNQFLSESIIRFVGNFFVIFGIGVFIFFLNVKLAIVALFSTVLILIVTKLISNFIQQANKKALAATGDLEAQIQESLSNFKVIVAFNRRDYFKEKLLEKNSSNFNLNIRSEIANGIFKPLYDFAGFIAQIAVLLYGIYLVGNGELSIGFLIGFLSYTQKFYDPLRILGSIWGNIQGSLAAWSRIREIMVLETDLKILPISNK